MRPFPFIICVLLLPISLSHASVMTVDDPVFGPNSLVLDTATGLEWLQPKFTFGQSPAQVLANPQFASFLYGTVPEFQQLGVDVFLPQAFPSLTGGVYSGLDTTKMTELIDLLGGICPFAFCGPSGLAGNLGPILPSLPSPLACRIGLQILNSPFLPPSQQGGIDLQCVENAIPSSFLVRSAVAEPSSICLLWAPVLGLALWQSRRRNHIA